MRRDLFLSGTILASLWLGSLSLAQSPKTTEDKAQLILGLEKAWNQAEVRHDSNALKLLLSESFIYVESDGTIRTRDEWLDSVVHDVKGLSELTNESQSARVLRETVIVTGIYREKVKIKGKTVVRRGRFTDTWVFENNHWNCAASQSTLITEP